MIDSLILQQPELNIFNVFIKKRLNLLSSNKKRFLNRPNEQKYETTNKYFIRRAYFLSFPNEMRISGS